MISEKGLKTQAQKSQIDWRKICRVMLDRALPMNPLTTQPDGLERKDDNITISLGSLLQQRQSSSKESALEPNELSYSSREDSITRTFQHEHFFEQVLAGGKSRTQGRKIVVIGESGTGKTLLLQKTADWVLEKTEDVPIWISASQLGTSLFDRYLRQKWLPQVAKDSKLPLIEWQEAFEELLNSGRVWLLIDGVDDRAIQVLSVVQQIRSWTQKVRIILTCRDRVWRNNQDALAAFDTYKTLEFNYPEQVKDFIKKWFNTPRFSSETQENAENSGEKLFKILDRPEKVQIRRWLENPLRLSLLCRLWQQQPQDLPSTRAELYKQLVPEFYQWKAETTATNSEQQQQLNEALGKLALQAMEEKSSDRIPHRLVTQIVPEDTPLFRLAIRLGWLQNVGVFTENPHEKYYTFFDPTFQEYFAACAIDDWDFFLNPQQNNYRLFEPQWKQVVLMWLGRVEIAKEEKEALMTAAIEFNDKCGYENFYGKRTYFLAAAGLAEFPDCNRADEIVAQIVKWGFSELKSDRSKQKSTPRPIAEAARSVLLETARSRAIALLVRLLEAIEDESLRSQVFASLEKIGKNNTNAIAALNQKLDSASSEAFNLQLADCLGTIDPGNQKAIATLTRLLAPNTSEDLQQIAFNSLEKIGKGDRKAIAALLSLIRTTGFSTTGRRAFECLEIVGRGNSGAIAALVQLIRASEDEGMRRQTAESLEKIDPGNPTAIAVLIQLLKSANNEEIRKKAVYSLGEIEPGNSDAIAALVQLLKTSEDIFVRWIAVSSLGKIGKESPEAIDALVEIVKSSDRILLRKEAIDSLVKIQSNHPVAISALVKLMQYADDEDIRREAADSLGKIDPANSTAIAALGYLLRTSYDEFTCRQAAYSLGKIAPNNPEAIKALIRLIHLSQDKDIRSLAAESLGEVGKNNPAAIATIVRLIQSSRDKDTFKQAIKSLGKIGRDNRDAIATLLGLLGTSEDETTRLLVADSLLELLQDRQMMPIVSALRDSFLYRTAVPDIASYKIIWHCAQRLPYSEFHQAWYFRPLPVEPEIDNEPDDLFDEEAIELDFAETTQTDNASTFDLSSSLSQAILAKPELNNTIKPIYIDSSQFIDPDNPLVDIYDCMLAQNCPQFEYGVPDTMAKLRLYWNMLRRNDGDRSFVLIFYENVADSQRKGFSPAFLEILSKFEGAICVVSEQNVSKLKHFSFQEPKLVQAILDWIEEQTQDVSADKIS
ncbi:MAG: HEAT repeat domain-containing protein [Hydrococcus sp. Prado102]|jgi:HEAT repeat protein|nr:HEAT repeat domain-containing protein [Hydrococcus sp. Prado102]